MLIFVEVGGVVGGVCWFIILLKLCGIIYKLLTGFILCWEEK